MCCCCCCLHRRYALSDVTIVLRRCTGKPPGSWTSTATSWQFTALDSSKPAPVSAQPGPFICSVGSTTNHPANQSINITYSEDIVKGNASDPIVLMDTTSGVNISVPAASIKLYAGERRKVAAISVACGAASYHHACYPCVVDMTSG